MLYFLSISTLQYEKILFIKEKLNYNCMQLLNILVYIDIYYITQLLFYIDAYIYK